MKKALLFAGALLLLLCAGCGTVEPAPRSGGDASGRQDMPAGSAAPLEMAAPADGETAEDAGADAKYSFDRAKPVFRYGEKEYDMSQRDQMITAIDSCTPVGQYLLVDCHPGPHNAVYSIFNTETEEFERDIVGANLIYHDDDIQTIVYSFWSDICDYNGDVIASLDLESSELIRDLAFSDDYTQVEVSIYSDAQECRVEQIPLC